MNSVDVILILLMLPLLVVSALFSMSETVFFGLAEVDRMRINQRSRIASRAVNRLLARPRMLLITVLLGNMTVNTLYFVIGSVLSVRNSTNVLIATLIGVLTITAIVVAGEVVPKVVGGALRVRVALVLAPPLSGLHQLLGPVRVFLESFIIAPLARLTAPSSRPRELNSDELDALIELSGREGVIDPHEHELLREVIRIRELRVSDVMMPRVDMPMVTIDVTREELLALIDTTRSSYLVVREREGDRVVGLLKVRDFLISPKQPDSSIASFLQDAHYVPELASIEQLLTHFQTSGTSIAVVLDEWGGTAGVVTLEDVVEEFVGDIRGFADSTIPEPERLGDGSWRVSGATSLEDWERLFGSDLALTRVRTVAGLFLDRFGRMPEVGDRVSIGNVQCEVESIDGQRISTVLVRVEGGLDEHP
ncbi:MAG: hemolysin family protein [Planctomycetota bacterium]|nr:hemolysin family protein [Planctomycetota bacterium]